MFRTQADAVREARTALWGDVHHSKRACLYPEPGTYSIVVSADVNGNLVAIHFDNYGLLDIHGVKVIGKLTTRR